MLEIQGQYNIAKVFTDTLEPSAQAQIQTLCNQPFVSDVKIRVMPDVHAGAGCTIGTTMTVSDKVVPNLVGRGYRLWHGNGTVSRETFRTAQAGRNHQGSRSFGFCRAGNTACAGG